MDKAQMSVEVEIAYEAAKAAIAHVRLTLLLISALIGLGFFFLFNWHLSFEMTRAEGRRAVAAEIRRIEKIAEDLKGKDPTLAEEMENIAAKLKEEKLEEAAAALKGNPKRAEEIEKIATNLKEGSQLVENMEKIAAELKEEELEEAAAALKGKNPKRAEEMEKIATNLKDDPQLVENMEKSAGKLEDDHHNREFEVPLLHLRVSSPDFPVAILIIALALLLWLLFYSRKVNECLTYLHQKQGWSLVGHLLKFQFILIGKDASRPMQLAARFLPMGLPVLAIFFVISDCFDLYGFSQDPIKKLVFTSGAYDGWVAFRLLLEIALAGLVGYFGTRCRKEFLSYEEELTHFSEEYNRSAKTAKA
ncbi:MAG TPA: hypothetical protein VJW20_18765 [Candidatus Angelobacter sp.]|nr:hypothetical protein [Candidatus Angelobacter sp.]